MISLSIEDKNLKYSNENWLFSTSELTKVGEINCSVKF